MMNHCIVNLQRTFFIGEHLLRYFGYLQKFCLFYKYHVVSHNCFYGDNTYAIKHNNTIWTTVFIIGDHFDFTRQRKIRTMRELWKKYFLITYKLATKLDSIYHIAFKYSVNVANIYAINRHIEMSIIILIKCIYESQNLCTVHTCKEKIENNINR